MDDEYEEFHDYESLRNYFNTQLLDIAEDIDEEDVEKIRNFRAYFQDKYLTNPDVEKK